MTAIVSYQYTFSEKELKELARLLCRGAVSAELRSFQRFLKQYLDETMTVEEAEGFFDAH